MTMMRSTAGQEGQRCSCTKKTTGTVRFLAAPFSYPYMVPKQYFTQAHGGLIAILQWF